MSYVSDLGRPTVAIIGGGASGVLAALHLLRLPGHPAHIVLVERSGALGGIAYSRADRCHLLNVPAASVSAFADDPGHFTRWLDRYGRPGAADSFVPRQLYGHYLRTTLQSLSALSPDGDDVQVVPDEVVKVVPMGGRARLEFAGRPSLDAEVVVLATGHGVPVLPAPLLHLAGHERLLADPWSSELAGRIGSSATVTLLGSGLTAIDVLLSLADKGHRGPVHSISPRGWLPQAHAARPAPRPALQEDIREMPVPTARTLFHEARRLARQASAMGGDWRDAIDSLRPQAQALWQRLGPREQKRFLAHVESAWTVHRHRMAPEVAFEVDRLSDAGAFHLHAGRLTGASLDAGAGPALAIEVALRGGGAPRRWRTDWLVVCTGPSKSPFGTKQGLYASLAEHGTARPGPLGIGIDTGPDGCVLDSSGRRVPWLWALGPLRQGQLLESTAIPEIRAQAQTVAAAARQALADAHHIFSVEWAGVSAGR